MNDSIIAIFEDGVFKPLKSIDLPEHTKILLKIELEHKKLDATIVKSQKKALAKLVGIADSGLKNISNEHDKYLYEKE